MAQFCSMVHRLIGESQQLIRDELLFGSSLSSKPVPVVLWEKMRDNLTNKQPGWNFLKDYWT
jgi:hypothetical protein